MDFLFFGTFVDGKITLSTRRQLQQYSTLHHLLTGQKTVLTDVSWYVSQTLLSTIVSDTIASHPTQFKPSLN